MKNINYKKILPLFFSVVFLTILFSSPVLSSGEFYEPIRFSSGNDSLISLDLNRDGNLDLISTDDSSRNGFSILLGNGDGTFANEIFYPTDNYTDVILGDDINNDNILDLIVSTYISNYPNIDRYLTTYLGNGDGTFAEVETYELSKKLVSDFTTGYFNEDSFIDIIISNNILLGNGDGTFDEAYIYTTIDLNGPYFVKSFDFNKDDNLDLVVINGESPNAFILLGNGDGTFNEAVLYLVGDDPTALSLADFNNDNNIDIAITNWSSLDISILLGNGDGTFNEAVFYEIENGQPHDIYTHDLDKDDNLDLFISEGYSDKFAILLGNGDGTFKNPEYYDSGSSATYNIIAEDFNNDSGIDVGLLNYVEDQYKVSIFLNKNIIEEEIEEESVINISDKIGINLNMLDVNTITENGDYIVFTSIDEITSEMIIYLYDKNNNTIERISKIPEEGEISGDIIAVISESGEYIGIVSGVFGGEGAFLSLYNTISKENELIATEEDLPVLISLFMGGSISISNNGDMVISPNFFTAMMSLMMIGGGSLPPEFSPIIFFYNNDNKEISIIEELTLENLYSPYSAHITSDGENIIYSTFFIPSLDFDPKTETPGNKYFIYNISNDEKEEIIIDNNPVNSFISTNFSISNNGRYLAFWTMNFEDMNPENFLIIVYDRQTEEIHSFPFFDFLSQTSFLEEEGALTFNSIDISNDGRYLVFSFNSLIKYMDSKNLNSYPLFIYDKIKNESLILDDGNSYMSASLSSDAKYITFSSPDQLTEDDTDDFFDVFLMLNPLYEEEEEEPSSSRRSSRSSGSSAGLINEFIQEQIQRAIAVGIEDYVPDLCLNVPAIQTEIPSGWVTNDQHECFFEELPPQEENIVVVAPIEENIIRIPPKTETAPIVEEQEEEIVEEIEEEVVEVEEEEVIKEIDEEIVEDQNQEATANSTNFIIWLGTVLGENYSKMANYIGDGVYDFFETLLKEQTGKTIATIISTIGASLGIYFGLIKTLFVNPISFSEIPMIPMRLWNLMMIAFGFKKKTRPWGTVYDSTTKQPLDPVYVTVSDLNGNEVATCITDLDGRYGFLLPPGIYQIKAGKNNYQFPSNKLQGQISDIIYQDLYFGGNIEVREGEVVTKNIPMDSLTFDWNEFAKKDKKLMKFFSKRDLWVTKISDYLFGIGLIFSIFMIFISPSIYNNVVFVIYLILLILKNTVLRPKLFGQVTNSNGLPLSFSILRFFRSGSEHEVIHKVADQNGRYYCLVPNGSYYAKIENKNTDESYTPVYTSESIEVKRGYIDEKFRV